MVVEMPDDFHVPATGTINYQYILREGQLHGGRVGDRRRNAPRRQSRVCITAKSGFVRRGSKWMADADTGRSLYEAAKCGRNSAEGNDILGKFNPGFGAQTSPWTAPPSCA